LSGSLGGSLGGHSTSPFLTHPGMLHQAAMTPQHPHNLFQLSGSGLGLPPMNHLHNHMAGLHVKPEVIPPITSHYNK